MFRLVRQADLATDRLTSGARDGLIDCKLHRNLKRRSREQAVRLIHLSDLLRLDEQVSPRVPLEMKITRRFRLVDHLLDQDTSGAICNHPVDGIAFLATQDRGADLGEDR